MKKCVCLLIGLGILLPGCVRKKTQPVEPKKQSIKTESYSENKSQQVIGDEKVDAFVLDDDKGDYDLFEEAEKGAQKTAPAQTRGPVADTQGKNDWAWKEAEQENQQAHVIHFKFNSAKIEKDQQPLVEKNAELAKKMCKKGAIAVVEGHSCKITRSASYNQALSQRRANRVARRMKKLGVPEKCLKSVGRGTEQLLTDADGAEAQAVNRRVEVRFLYPQA